MKNVSIVIPVYNAAMYLSVCLESVCGQTYGDLEILCSYDNSCDNSFEIIQDFAKRDKRIKILTHGDERPCSPAHNRNAGLDAASGEFIRFVDSDDAIPLDSTSILVDSIESGVHDASRGGLDYFNEDMSCVINKIRVAQEKRKNVFPISESHDVINSLLYGHYAYLFRLSFLRKYNIRYATQLRVGEDLFFVHSAFFRINALSLVPESVYSYRIRSGSEMTGNKSYGWFQDIISTYRLTYQLAIQHDQVAIADRNFLQSMNGYLGKEVLPFACDCLTVAEQDSILSSIQNIVDEYGVLYRLKKHDFVRLGVNWSVLEQLLLISIWTGDYDTTRTILQSPPSCALTCESLRVVKKELETIRGSGAYRLYGKIRDLYRMFRRR